MATIKKIVQIPSDRYLRLDLPVPDGVPAGKAEVLLIISTATEKRTRKPLVELAGSLAGSAAFSRNSVELQREWRDEWRSGK